MSTRFSPAKLRRWGGISLLLAWPLLVAAALPDGLALRRAVAAFFAATALGGMALSLLLATRANWLESLFGGLDRMYVVHRYAGVVALVAIALHWLLVPDGLQTHGVNVAEFGSDAGEWATWALLALLGLSFLPGLPYHWWRWTHKLMGLVFAISVLHLLFAAKPFSLLSPLGLALLVLAALGLWAWCYQSFGFNRSRRYLARVVALERQPDLLDIVLQPVAAQPRWRAGQFAFLSLDKPGLREAHPFTIASEADSGRPRFVIKALGDFTKRLQGELAIGDRLHLEMPHGRFTLRADRHTRQAWIGAGVGITPFLAFCGELARRAEAVDARLYYCVRERADAVYLDELQARCARVPGLSVELVCSSEERLQGERVAHWLGEEIDRAHLYFCGGEAMRDALRDDLVARGLDADRFHFEYFSFK